MHILKNKLAENEIKPRQNQITKNNQHQNIKCQVTKE